MKKLQKPQLQDYEIQQLKETFDLFDTEGSGRIDPRVPRLCRSSSSP